MKDEGYKELAGLLAGGRKRRRQASLRESAGSASDLYRKPTAAEIWKAIDDWMTDRRPRDPSEIALAKIWLRKRRETITRCPGCDGECGEDCALTAEQHWEGLAFEAKHPGTPPWPQPSKPNND